MKILPPVSDENLPPEMSGRGKHKKLQQELLKLKHRHWLPIQFDSRPEAQLLRASLVCSTWGKGRLSTAIRGTTLYISVKKPLSKQEE